MSKQKKQDNTQREEKKDKKDKNINEEEVLENTDEQPEETDSAAEETDSLAEFEKQLSEEKDKFLRLAAEYDNYRKRTQKEREGVYNEAKADTVKQFLPVYDNIERALTHTTTDEAFYKGVEMIMAGLREIMSKLGVEEIPALGETFDPNYHNAVFHVEDDSKGAGEIIEELQKGFKIGERVIRFSLVKVAN